MMEKYLVLSNIGGNKYFIFEDEKDMLEYFAWSILIIDNISAKIKSPSSGEDVSYYFNFWNKNCSAIMINAQDALRDGDDSLTDGFLRPNECIIYLMDKSLYEYKPREKLFNEIKERLNEKLTSSIKEKDKTMILEREQNIKSLEFRIKAEKEQLEKLKNKESNSIQ